MARIELTQYLMPDGRTTKVHFEGSDELAAMVHELAGKGLALECEVLQTREVSVTMASEDEDVGIVVVPNGPGVAEAAEGMIREVYARAQAGEL